mgnify:FL=1
MKILLQGKSNLEHLFADIETKLVRQEFEKLNQENENIPTKMKTTIKQDDFWKILNLP